MKNSPNVSNSFRHAVKPEQLNPKKDRGNSARRPQPDELLVKLDHMWKEHHKVGLEIRFQTGQLLNKKFGKPSQKRQQYGESVLAEYAEKLGLAVSELSRMRCFAESVTTLEEFAKVHPNVKTWTAVKAFLAARGREDIHTATSPEPAEKLEGMVADNRIPVQKTLTVFKSFPKQLQDIHLERKDALWNELKETLVSVVEAASKCLGVSYVLQELPSTPGEAPPSQQNYAGIRSDSRQIEPAASKESVGLPREFAMA